MVDRLSGVRAQADDAARRIEPRCGEGQARIPVQCLEEPGPFGADIADAENRIQCHLPLDLETELLRVRRTKVFLNDGSREPVKRRRVTKISPERRQNRKCVRQVRAVDVVEPPAVLGLA